MSSSVFLFLFFSGVTATTFTVLNKCNYTIWPAIQNHQRSLKPEITGFELTKGSHRAFQASVGWVGRFWGRTSCNFSDSVNGSCATGDCGTGQVECNGAAANLATTLVEFTIGSSSQDFYDVSLMDGYNLPVIVEGFGRSGDCASTGCVTDLNNMCPSDLRIDGVAACKSACAALEKPEYCCSGAYSSPEKCKPSNYSNFFKSACPNAYSYAFDDTSSAFACSPESDYTITFCPNVQR